MPHTSPAIEPIPAATDEERLRRLRHANAFARLTVGATVLAALFSWWMGTLWVTIGCCLTALGMSCASHLLQRRMLDAGVWLISLTAGAMLFGFTWLGDGLLDSVLLGVPILFVAAAQWLRPKPFLALVGCTLAGVVLIGVASHLGWRADPDPGRQVLRVVDTLLILSIGGLVVWLLTQEMSERLSTLRRQVEKHRAAGKRLSSLTDHDHLTQLPGRKMGAEMLAHALTEAARSRGQVALMAVKIGEFGAISKTLGQGGADILLVHMAARLHALRGAQDVLMRIGADEFLLGLTDVRSADDAAHVAEAVLSMASETLEIEGQQLTPACSIGIAMYPRDGQDFETLVRRATAAVRHTKSAGRHAFRFSTDVETPSAFGHLDAVNRMRHALQNKRFELYYQPVVELTSGQWTGVEALLCWPQDDGRVMSAGEFMHTAERSGLVIDLGEWALRQACKQIRRWQIESSNPSLTAAVSVSPLQLRRGNFVDMVRSAL
ncbi:MAG: hypothetical protein RLZZ126_248, partial [Pseudomonadota bacterium]